MKDISAFDTILTRWMAKYGISFLRMSLALIFIWFGGLKFIPGASPAEELALSTISILTFDLISPQIAQFMLASLETLIGLLLITGSFMRFAILLLLIQMGGTMSPILLFPELVFNQFPFVLTIEGQYIFKNFVVISAAIVIGATVRGGKLSADPDS